ncbi:hypothetical protein AB0H83_02150 [Dactylosporangium sp. NPDC050688]|uniref:hypothetical protein n=1 Tax=Dactylosporangium sp. NPDC050688 TaxID=3157217 RepID=UPI0033E27843
MRFTFGPHSAEIDFPVWDVVTDLPRDSQLGSTIDSADAIDGVSVVRGRPPLERGDEMSPGFVVWSFDPAAMAQDSSYLTRMAALAFIQPLETHAGETVQSATQRVMSLIDSAGEPATLAVEGREIPGEIYVFDGVGILAVPKSPDTNFAAACFGFTSPPAFCRLVVDA